MLNFQKYQNYENFKLWNFDLHDNYEFSFYFKNIIGLKRKPKPVFSFLSTHHNLSKYVKIFEKFFFIIEILT